MSRERLDLVLLVELHERAWAVQLVAGEPEPGMVVRCVETGERFRVEVAGSIDARALVAGRRILRFYPISSDPRDLRKGYRMNQEPTISPACDGDTPLRGDVTPTATARSQPIRKP